MKNLTILILIFFNMLVSQTFTDINAGLTGVYSGDTEWGDYDNDGDLDILITGNTGTEIITKIYRNDSGIFTDIEAGLPGVYGSSVAWGDYDNDRDLDILLKGETGSGGISRIYRNDSGVFTDINAGLLYLAGSAVWGDYDNDGDLDVLLTGYAGSNNGSTIYRNDLGVFTYINANLPNSGGGSAAWGDYDNDGDLDILLSGLNDIMYEMGNEIVYTINGICRNEGDENFVCIDLGFPSLCAGKLIWGDYDDDGDLDILSQIKYLRYSDEVITKIHRNDAGIFTDINAGLTDAQSGDIAWGDYDNDGDLDILMISKIYRNDSGVFTDINAGLSGVNLGSVAWGDYDNDGDLDILLTGINTAGRISKIYRNDSVTLNTKPNPPVNLSTDYIESRIVLSWDKATDAETPQDGLSYNIYIGSTSQTENVYSPMSDIFTGYRKIVSIGNANQNTSWTVKNLPTGEYYWSVQAIDNCFAGSEFAPEQCFTSIEDSSVPLSTTLYQNYPNPFNPETEIKFNLQSKCNVNIAVFNSKGELIKILLEGIQDKGLHSLRFDASELNSGIYFYKLTTEDNSITRKMLLLR